MEDSLIEKYSTKELLYSLIIIIPKRLRIYKKLLKKGSLRQFTKKDFTYWAEKIYILRKKQREIKKELNFRFYF